MSRDLYAEVKAILGTTGVIVPLGDSAYENAARTTVTTTGGGGSHVWSYKSADVVTARTAWARQAYYLRNRYRTPVLPFDGLGNTLTTPDIDYYSRGDGVSDFSFSIVVTCKLRDATNSTFFSKYGAEYEWRLNGADKFVVSFRDASAVVEPFIVSDAALTADENQAHQYGFVFDVSLGSGATVANGMALYRDGVALAVTRGNEATYVAMENGAVTPRIGAYSTNQEFFDGEMYGGAIGLAFTQVALTAAQMAAMNEIKNTALRNRMNPLLFAGRH